MTERKRTLLAVFVTTLVSQPDVEAVAAETPDAEPVPELS
jgi:hypothetical protein